MPGNGVEIATAYVSIVGETSKLAGDIKKAFEGVDRESLRAGKKIGDNLSAGLGGTKNEAAKAGADAAEAYERSLQSQLRGQQLGERIGRPIGKGLGLAIKGGIAVAATGAAAAVAGVGTALAKGFGRLKNIDAAKFKLQALGHSAGDVQKIMDSALASVKGTAYGMDEAASAAAVAVAAGVPQGQALTDYLKNVADAASIAQTSMDEMGHIFNKVQTSGKAFTEDLNMLGDRGLPIFTWLQKQFGVTGDALAKMVSDGKVSAADFQRAIHDNIGGAAQEMGKSFDGAMQNLDAAVSRVGADFLSAALGGNGLNGPTDGINNLTKALDGLDAWIKAHQGDIMSFFANMTDGVSGMVRMTLNSLAELVGGLAVTWNAIADTFGGMVKVGGKIAGWFGNEDMAKEWGEWSEELFNSAEGLYKIKDGLKESADAADDWGNRTSNGMKRTADRAHAVQDAIEDVGTAIQVVPKTKDVILSSNAPEVMEKIDQTKYKLENLPDGTVKIIPQTDDAQVVIDRFVMANDPLSLKAAVETSPAEVAMNRLVEQYGNLSLPAKVELDTTAAEAKLSGLASRLSVQARVEDVPTHRPANPPAARPPTNTGQRGAPGPYLPYDPALPGPVRLPRRAAGGPINGPGPQGKDSVLMWGAPGEHMLTDEDVRNLGGHAGVYALRAAAAAGRPFTVPGYDRGGAIKQGAIVWPQEDLGPSDKTREGGVPDIDPGRMPGTKGLPDWGEGVLWGPPPANWWTDPINPDDILFPKWWPPGMRDIWQHPYGPGRKTKLLGGLPGYENGGAIAAVDNAYQNRGKKYQYGDWDCSMYLSQVYAGMRGLPPGRYFNTESDFESMGFKRGYKAGALNIGIRRGGGGPNSHMAGTLPNGVNIENSGGGSMYGGDAAGAQDFPLQYYYEPDVSGDMGELQARAAAGDQNAAMLLSSQSGNGVGTSTSGGLGSASSGRTEGYAPSGAQNSGRTGNSLFSGFLDMGAQAVNGLIDQAASAASSAAGLAATAGSFGADGGAGGMAAQMAIGMGTQAAKRGVEYGFEMAGIGIDSIAEILNPFGMLRLWNSDPTAFMPNLNISPASVTSAEQALSSAVDPNTTTHGQGVGAAPGPAAPTANLAVQDPANMAPTQPGLTIGSITGMNPEDVSGELLRYQRLNALQYQGRP